MPAKIEIYTTDYCPYCTKAKQLLSSLGAAYEEKDVTHDQAGRTEAIERSGGRRTVPQIFIDDKAMGGFDDINLLHMQGKLEPLLK